VALVRTDISEEGIARRSKLADSCHRDDGSDMFLRNVSSYKSSTASHPRRLLSTKLYFIGKQNHNVLFLCKGNILENVLVCLIMSGRGRNKRNVSGE
jgi:hypothetical protein